MTKDEALKLALEVMRNQGDVSVDEWIATEKAIKEALANEALEKMAENARELGLDYEPEQEPVAWRAWVSKFPQGTGSDWVYVTKPIMKDSIHNQPLYTTPPQRTWVGLMDIDYAGLPLEQVGLVRWAEAKLKEKNT
jgi:hypothetical protein